MGEIIKLEFDKQIIAQGKLGGAFKTVRNAEIRVVYR